MSEPGVGTDVMGMSTSARLSADGQDYVLNGTKMWITNGTVDGTNTGNTSDDHYSYLSLLLPNHYYYDLVTLLPNLSLLLLLPLT